MTQILMILGAVTHNAIDLSNEVESHIMCNLTPLVGNMREHCPSCLVLSTPFGMQCNLLPQSCTHLVENLSAI